MTIEYWKLEKFVPYSRKLRDSDHAIDRMMAGICEYGFKIPVLALSSGEVVDGHLRLKAARRLGLDEIPVILCDEWSPAQIKGFRFMVNQSPSWADWNPEFVSLELEELKNLDFPLELTGFDPLELDEFLFGAKTDEQADVIPEAPPSAVSRVGDLWVCDSHRALCGDATSVEDVNRLLDSKKPELMVTDPPYGVEYDPLWRERAGLGQQRQTGTVANDDQVDWRRAYSLFAGAVAYVWHAGIYAGEVAASLRSGGLRIRGQIIWAKQHFALSRGDYH
jgi:hypothetical protein